MKGEVRGGIEFTLKRSKERKKMKKNSIDLFLTLCYSPLPERESERETKERKGSRRARSLSLSLWSSLAALFSLSGSSRGEHIRSDRETF